MGNLCSPTQRFYSKHDGLPHRLVKAYELTQAQNIRGGIAHIAWQPRNPDLINFYSFLRRKPTSDSYGTECTQLLRTYRVQLSVMCRMLIGMHLNV
jgi:hypothetical protein